MEFDNNYGWVEEIDLQIDNFDTGEFESFELDSGCKRYGLPADARERRM